jgi:hypothetical protein
MKQAQLDAHASSLCVKVAWLHRVGGTPPPHRGSDRSGSTVRHTKQEIPCASATQEIPQALRPYTEAPTTSRRSLIINKPISLANRRSLSRASYRYEPATDGRPDGSPLRSRSIRGTRLERTPHGGGPASETGRSPGLAPSYRYHHLPSSSTLLYVTRMLFCRPLPSRSYSCLSHPCLPSRSVYVMRVTQATQYLRPMIPWIANVVSVRAVLPARAVLAR